jgi:hypothetical protein
MPTFDRISASRAVLIEVMNVLGRFREDIVLVGGWVPDLLYPNMHDPGELLASHVPDPFHKEPAGSTTMAGRERTPPEVLL